MPRRFLLSAKLRTAGKCRAGGQPIRQLCAGEWGMSTLTFNAVYEDAGSGWANARTCRSWPKPIRKGEGLVLTANLVRRDFASTQFREFTVPTWS